MAGKNLGSLGREVVVKMKDVNKSFRVGDQSVWVLKHLDLEIKRKEFVVLFGPSGSGKSTMLHVMLGLERPDTGSAQLMGLDMYQRKVDEDSKCRFRKQYVGMIYQQPNWIKSLNVQDNVAFPLLLQGVDKFVARERALEYLDMVGMKNWARYKPTELSSGQQQKVSLARALVNNPQILVADEPTGNLDYQSSEDLMQLLRKLVDEGKTVVMVTHEIANLSFADRILRFLDGQIVGELDTKGMSKHEMEESILQLSPERAEYDLADAPAILSDDEWSDTKINGFRKRWSKRLNEQLQYAVASVLTFGLIMLYGIFGLVDWLVNGSKLANFVPKRTRQSIDIKAKELKSKIDPQQFGSISKFYVVELSLNNMFAKRARTLVTVGGIAIGISFIVFLLSLGFGAEQLVISRVARLEELKQFEAIPAVNTQVKITDDTIAKFSQIDSVTDVSPLIGVAGRINYNNSAADVVVYGAQSKYLTQSAIRPLEGEIFKNDNLTNSYITSVIEKQDIPVAGPLFDESSVLDQVTEDAILASGVDNEDGEEINKVNLPIKQRQAVVNSVFLQVLGISQTEAVGKDFSSEFVITGNLTPENEKIETYPVKYSIVGVIEEGTTPLMYVPITDIREVGIEQFSLIKVSVAQEKDLKLARRQVELSGYRTTSVFDTVVQIEALFDNFRIILIIVGGIALAVASLGMFNTLTVSLLERTREVGLMKAIGMKADEVRDLFISESISMGFMGGVLGLIIGFILGKVLSLFLSVIAITRGFPGLDVTYLPSEFFALIIVLSGLVGVVTGFYPAIRATRISALNALRYE